MQSLLFVAECTVNPCLDCTIGFANLCRYHADSRLIQRLPGTVAHATCQEDLNIPDLGDHAGMAVRGMLVKTVAPGSVVLMVIVVVVVTVVVTVV
jgi:hypothetical protein